MSSRWLLPRCHGRTARRSRLRLVALTLAGAVGFGALAFLASAAAELASESRLFTVKGVKVRGTVFLTAEAVADQIGDVAGASLMSVHPGDLIAQLCAHPRIRAARVRRGLDRHLLVEVEEREPVALLDAGMLVEVDAEGVVLPPVERAVLPDVPVLTGAGGRMPVPGSMVTMPAVRDALRLLTDLAALDPVFLAMISEIDLKRSPLYRIHLSGRPQVLVAHARSFSAAKLAGLRTVLKDLDTRGRTLVEVDLRFEGQLVVRDLM